MKTDTTNKGGFAKKVIIGGVSGVLLGSSSMATVGNAIIEDIAAADAEAEGTDSDYEDMSFGEAFASAREELGPDGSFEWHGNLYSTCTAEEWAASHPAVPLTEDGLVTDQEDEVEILGTEDETDDVIEAEIETASDINGDEAAFIEIEDSPQSDAMADIYVGPDNDQVSDSGDYSNDDVSIL